MVFGRCCVFHLWNIKILGKARIDWVKPQYSHNSEIPKKYQFYSGKHSFLGSLGGFLGSSRNPQYWGNPKSLILDKPHLYIFGKTPNTGKIPVILANPTNSQVNHSYTRINAVILGKTQPCSEIPKNIRNKQVH